MAAAKIAKTTGKLDKSLLKAMISAFAETALPGENEGFDAKAQFFFIYKSMIAFYKTRHFQFPHAF